MENQLLSGWDTVRLLVEGIRLSRVRDFAVHIRNFNQTNSARMSLALQNKNKYCVPSVLQLVKMQRIVKHYEIYKRHLKQQRFQTLVRDIRKELESSKQRNKAKSQQNSPISIAFTTPHYKRTSEQNNLISQWMSNVLDPSSNLSIFYERCDVWNQRNLISKFQFEVIDQNNPIIFQVNKKKTKNKK